MSENPRRIVLELEVILGGWNQLVSGTSEGLDTRLCKRKEVSRNAYMSKVDFCLASKSASVSGRSSLAFVRDTETRMPVSML